MSLYLRKTDCLQLLKPTGPVFPFVVPWLLVLIGQQLALCKIIISEYSSFYLIVLGNVISSFLIAFGVQILIPKNLADRPCAEVKEIHITNAFKGIVYFLLIFYFTYQFFQVIVFKGSPLIWLMVGDPRTYTDFGRLNGLFNSLYLFATTAYFLIYLHERRHWQVFVLVCLFLVPVLLVSRQLLVSVFLQTACCMMLYKPHSVKKIAKVGVFILLIFVVLGNFRTGLETLTEILQPESFIPTYLHSLLWIYAYFVTPFNNLNAAIDVVNPIGIPFYEITPMFPSMLQNFFELNMDYEHTGFSLVHENMTVSTFYLWPLLDFGRFYAFCFMCAFQLIFCLCYRKAQNSQDPLRLIKYSILYMVMFLSIFENLLLFFPVILQLILTKLCAIRIKK